mmetsp:Transcript_22227/g.45370  ORF Transcript_22227/g.45370 Transcript_22227/m.45370 type:complete len:231 (-) Transcript_22227:237-929(-)
MLGRIPATREGGPWLMNSGCVFRLLTSSLVVTWGLMACHVPSPFSPKRRTSQLRKETRRRPRSKLWCATTTALCSGLPFSHSSKRPSRAWIVFAVSKFTPSLRSHPSYMAEKSSRCSCSLNMSLILSMGDPVSHGTSPVSCKSGMSTSFRPSFPASHFSRASSAVWIVRRSGDTTTSSIPFPSSPPMASRRSGSVCTLFACSVPRSDNSGSRILIASSRFPCSYGMLCIA